MSASRPRWTTNLLLKTVALLLALFLWNLYRTEEQAIRFVTVPLQFQNLSADRELSGQIPGSVTVQVQAPEPMARTLTPDWITARVDLSTVALGESSLRIGPESIQVPSGVRVMNVVPDQIPFTVERKVRKLVPVEARHQGEVAPGFELRGIRLLPDRVTVEGPESEVARAEKAITDWVSVRGRSASFQEGVSVLPPEEIRVRVVGSRSAIASVDIAPAGGDVAPEAGEEGGG